MSGEETSSHERIGEALVEALGFDSTASKEAEGKAAMNSSSSSSGGGGSSKTQSAETKVTETKGETSKQDARPFLIDVEVAKKAEGSGKAAAEAPAAASKPVAASKPAASKKPAGNTKPATNTKANPEKKVVIDSAAAAVSNTATKTKKAVSTPRKSSKAASVSPAETAPTKPPTETVDPSYARPRLKAKPPSGSDQNNRIRARKVRRVIRHVDPWSVLTFAALFHLCVFASLLLAGILVWTAASGPLENLENFIRELGASPTFEIDGDAVFRSALVIMGVLTLASSVLAVLLSVVFNLISDLVGGIRVTVVEEDTVRPVSEMGQGVSSTNQRTASTN